MYSRPQGRRFASNLHRLAKLLESGCNLDQRAPWAKVDRDRRCRRDGVDLREIG